MFKHKKYAILAASVLVLAACGGGTSTTEDPSVSTPGSTPSSTPTRVRLQVWGPQKEGEKEVYEHLAAEFQKANPSIEFLMSYGDVGEADAATQALADVDTAADVFMFADDQLANLVGKGVLTELSDFYGDKVKERDLASAVDAATFGDKLYGFPVAADNGYFLMYNNEFFEESDVLTLEAMFEKTDANHQIAIDMGNGYYALSPIMNVGDITYDPTEKVHATNFNETASVKAMEGFEELIQANLDTGFKAINVDDILADFGDAQGNKIVAAVSGMWNADNIQEELGTRFAATKLPSFTSKDGTSVQMGSFAGSKLVGVKSNAQNQAWALAFADFITSEAAQLYRFEQIGKGPSNIVVSASDAVDANPGLAALGAQAAYAIPQSKSVGGSFWDPAAAVGNFVVNGPTEGSSVVTVQDQLDAFVAAVTMTI
jgi:arabinogalactan oligomer/maltooligosaccharide transport system substrate-binding protein